jgi:hypothetical protein
MMMTTTTTTTTTTITMQRAEKPFHQKRCAQRCTGGVASGVASVSTRRGPTNVALVSSLAVSRHVSRSHWRRFRQSIGFRRSRSKSRRATKHSAVAAVGDSEVCSPRVSLVCAVFSAPCASSSLSLLPCLISCPLSRDSCLSCLLSSVSCLPCPPTTRLRLVDAALQSRQLDRLSCIFKVYDDCRQDSLALQVWLCVVLPSRCPLVTCAGVRGAVM